MDCQISGCRGRAQLTVVRGDRTLKVCSDCGPEMEFLDGWERIGVLPRRDRLVVMRPVEPEPMIHTPWVRWAATGIVAFYVLLFLFMWWRASRGGV